MNEDLIRLAFAGIAPATIDRLIERHGTPRRVVTAVGSGRTKLTSRAVEAVRVGADDRFERLSRLGVSFVARGEDGCEFRESSQHLGESVRRCRSFRGLLLEVPDTKLEKPIAGSPRQRDNTNSGRE